MKSKVPVFRVQMAVRGLIVYDREFGDAETAIARARAMASDFMAIEVESSEDLLRSEIQGIIFRAFMIPPGVESLESSFSYRSQLQDVEEATDRYIALRDQTGHGAMYLLPVPRPKKTLIEVGRFVVFTGDVPGVPDKSVGQIESVSASGRTVQVSGCWRSKVNVSNIFASFRHRKDAEAVVQHRERTEHMLTYVEQARAASMTEIIDDAE